MIVRTQFWKTDKCWNLVITYAFKAIINLITGVII